MDVGDVWVWFEKARICGCAVSGGNLFQKWGVYKTLAKELQSTALMEDG